MDVLKALRELYLEKSRLDRLIAICESKIKEQDRRLSRSKRGRKSMSADERKIVSERMRNYWAKRRTGPDDGGGESGPGAEPAGEREETSESREPRSDRSDPEASSSSSAGASAVDHSARAATTS